MSTENANSSLSDCLTPEDNEGDESDASAGETRPAWTPTSDDSSTAARCQNCNSRVTRRFARVFGDNEDEVHGCGECMTMSDVKRGGTLEGRTGTIDDNISLGGGL